MKITGWMFVCHLGSSAHLMRGSSLAERWRMFVVVCLAPDVSTNVSVVDLDMTNVDGYDPAVLHWGHLKNKKHCTLEQTRRGMAIRLEQQCLRYRYNCYLNWNMWKQEMQMVGRN